MGVYTHLCRFYIQNNYNCITIDRVIPVIAFDEHLCLMK